MHNIQTILSQLTKYATKKKKKNKKIKNEHCIILSNYAALTNEFQKLNPGGPYRTQSIRRETT